MAAQLFAAGVAALFSSSTLADAVVPPDGQYAVPTALGGVQGAFNGLSKRPDALAIYPATGRVGTTCKHYQGIARVHGTDGTPYLIMTKSGNKSICVLEDDEPGWLIVMKLGSRPKSGERLGSNVLPYGSTDHSVYPEPMATFEHDRVVSAFRLDGQDVAASFRHPGGIQLAGNVIAIGAETGYNGEPSGATVLFFDVSNPELPTLTSKFHVPGSGSALGADPVGLAPIPAEDGTCCRYLLVVSGGDGNDRVQFFISQPDPGRTTTTLSSADLAWLPNNKAFTAGELSSCIGQTWPTAGLVQGGQHQMLNFVREGGLGGPLYMIGGRRDGTIVNPFVDEYLDLYRVNLSPEGAIQDCPFTHVATKTVGTDAWANEGTTSTFSAAGGVYVSPSGELIVYNGKHDLTTRFDLSDPQNPVVLSYHISVGEYRIGSLVRADSPLLRPTAAVDGPFAVDEGGMVPLTGRGEQARQKAFVQLFEDDGVGLGLPGWLDSDEWLSVEYADRNADRFHSLDQLGGDADEIWDNVGSVRWFAPPGCTISANDYPGWSDSWPGPNTVLLRGTGRFEEEHDLDDLRVYTPADSLWPAAPVPADVASSGVDYDDDIEGVTFHHQVPFGDGVANRHDCDSYYVKPIGLGWDLDSNGSFEASGTVVTFDAFALDGPSTATVRARAQHPTDTSPTGSGDPFALPVQVRNVAPQIGAATVADSLGRDLSGGSTPAIVGLPVTLSVGFTDPGRPDTQTASVDWNDGSGPDTSFAEFSDARNGATGRLVDSRVFAAAGTKTIAATVTDDDGGATVRQVTIVVLSLVDAIEHVADRLTALIASTTDPEVAAALRAARDELIGNHGGKPPTNGATDKLDADDPSGAIVKLKAALEDLLAAEALGGGDLSALEDLLGLVAEGIATATYEDAKAAIPTPSPGQARTLATIAALIRTGHERLAGQEYLDACDSFKSATDKALGLLK
ncbi:MAG TPA: hypothetical protein VF139_15045 [Candidatus Polarisedimenticolaceae bacterium]